MAKTYLYFAYGSNLHMAQMKGRCPGSKPMYKAELPYSQMLFKYYADVIKTKGTKESYTQGAVYQITRDDMRNLDHYEGYPTLYRKVYVTVRIKGSDEYVQAFMYVMQPNARSLQLPRTRYFETIAQGYADWNIQNYTLLKAWEDTAYQLGALPDSKGKYKNIPHVNVNAKGHI